MTSKIYTNRSGLSRQRYKCYVLQCGDKNLASISVRPKECYTKRVICMRVKLRAGVLIVNNVETQVYTNYISPFVTFCDVMGWTSQAPGNRRSQWWTMKTDRGTLVSSTHGRAYRDRLTFKIHYWENQKLPFCFVSRIFFEVFFFILVVNIFNDNQNKEKNKSKRKSPKTHFQMETNF